MEARLGADFADVRLHTDTAAGHSATELGARAYTAGEHVVIGPGGGDRHTLAHELTHVIQQRSGPVAGTPTDDGFAMSDPGDAYERAAEANARRVMTGGAPEVHHDVGDRHTGHAHQPVQRMPLAQFQQQVGALANDVDFITFVEIRRGREDPAAVVADSASGSQARLEQLVRDVTPESVTQYMNDYQGMAAGTRQQPRNISRPMVVGLEMEMRNAVLQLEEGMANGEELARTPVTTEVGPPVMKLVVEGMEPGDPGMELVYGPLAPDEYKSPALISARNKLKTAIRRAGTMAQLVTVYNKSLQTSEQRYRLVPGPHQQWRKKATPTPRIGTQTNVSTPYSKVGRTNNRPEQDFGAFFESNSQRRVHDAARTQAAALVTKIAAHWNANYQNLGQLAPGINLGPMLTHLLYQEAMYANHQFDRNVIGHDDKHAFHVLLKLSPQDVAMGLITDDEAKLLLAWLADNKAKPIAAAVLDTFKAFNKPYAKVTVESDAIYQYMVDVLVARLLADQQLLGEANDEDRTSAVFGNARQVADVTHFHPRPSNRRPINVSGNKYFMVVEQRSMVHAVNSNAESNPRLSVEQMKNLQKPTT